MVTRFIGLETWQPSENQEAEAPKFKCLPWESPKSENPGEVCAIWKRVDPATLCHEILHAASAADH